MSRIGNRTGFTLVEVLITTVVVAVSIAGIIRSYTVLLGALKISRTYVMSASLLKEKMAEIEGEQREGIAMPQGVREGVFPYNPDFGWKTEVAAADMLQLRSLKLTVMDLRGKPSHDISLVTYVKNTR